MNKKLLRAMGFETEVRAVEEGKCPFCKNPVKIEDFDDELSKKEFTMSGLCKNCQSKVFNVK